MAMIAEAEAIVSPSLLACDLADITNQVYILMNNDKHHHHHHDERNTNTETMMKKMKSRHQEEDGNERNGDSVKRLNGSDTTTTMMEEDGESTRNQGQKSGTRSANACSDTRAPTTTTSTTTTCSPQWVHVDVMDGHFVPNLSFGGPVLASLDKALRRDGRRSEFVLDCHLMVTNPEMYVEEFRKAGADMFTFHHEAASRPEGTYIYIFQM